MGRSNPIILSSRITVHHHPAPKSNSGSWSPRALHTKVSKTRGESGGLTQDWRQDFPPGCYLPQSADWAMTIPIIQCSFQCKNLAVRTVTKHASSQGKLRTTHVATTVLNTILTFMVQAVNSILATAIGAAGGHQLWDQSPAPPGWEGGGSDEGRKDAEQAVCCEWAASPGTSSL